MILPLRQERPRTARNRGRYLARFGVLLLFLCALLGSAPRASAALGDLVATFNLPANRMAVDPIRPRIYATLTGSNAVAVIDTDTLSVVQIIPIGSNPVGLAESADGSTLYVANSGSTVDGVGVIDLNTLTTLPSIATPDEPSDIAVGLNGWLYLTPADNDITIGAVMQVSTTGTAQAQFGSEYVEGGAFLAISPDRKTLYYGDAGLSPATLASFDVSTGTAAPLQEADFGSVGSNGEDLEISHSGAILCFAVGSGQGNYSIAEIPTANLNDSLGLFTTGPYPTNIAFSPDDTLAYAAPESQNQVRVFNTSTFVQTGSFPVSGEIGRLTTDGAGRYLFATVLNEQDGPASISVYDTGRAPAITSSTTATAGLGAAFSYQITATNSPTSFNATGLPAGLSVDPATGVISGTATATGGSQVVISASNAIGVTTADLTLTVFSGEGLTVSVNGGGTVTSSLLGATYHTAGSHISITATPSPGYVFSGWTGDITSSSGTLAFTLDSPTSIQANFIPGPPAVTSTTLGALVATFNLAANRLAVDPIRPRIYASLTGSNAVAVIDTSTLTLIKVIPIGSNPVGLAESADGNTLYVANSGSTTDGIGVIDLNTLATLPSIATPEEPSDIAVGLNGRLYLTPAVNDITIGAVMQVSTTGTSQAQFGSEYVEGGAFLAISPDRKTLYYGDAGLSPATLASFDVSTGTAAPLDEAAFDTVGSNGQDLEISHSGAFLCFAVGSGQGDYSIAEIPSGDLGGSYGLFDTGAYPSNIGFSPDDAVAYSAPESQDTVYVFDASTFTTIGEFPTPGDVSRLQTDGSGKYLFVAGLNNYYSSNAAIYVYATGRAAAVITSNTSVTAPSDMAFSYQITASNSPTSFNATGLPAGLSINPATGVISGTAATPGESQVIISASNAIGVAFATLTISAGEGLTVSVNGGGTVTGGFPGTNYYLPGSAISIQATPDAGYVFSGWTGDITSGSNPLDFTLETSTMIQANFTPLSPAVTSAIQDAEYGAPFTYQINASGAGPITYSATGLPQGLSLNAGTGLITGTLAAAGNFTVGISGSNSAGSGTGALWLDVTARLTVGAGSGGYVEPAGTSYLPLGSSVSLLATPVNGYAFKDWTGDFTSFANPLAFALPSTAQVLANFVPWTTYDGAYSGLILSGTPTGINSGILSVRVIAGGLFIGSVIVDGVKYPIIGSFPASNSTEISIYRKNLPPLIVTLNLDGSVSPPQVTGSVTAGTWTGEISAELSPVDSASNPSPRAGLYTAALYSSTESMAIPAGTGYATISVNAAGVAKVIGTLADNTPFSESATISPDGTLPVYAALYRKKGVLLGTLEFESATNVGEIAGTLNWLRPATSGTGSFAAGFSTSLEVAGSSYDQSAGLGATQGMVSFAGGNISAPFNQAFSINGAGKFIVSSTNPHSVTLTLDQKTGAFSGTFIDARRTRRFHGVILQEQLAGAGVFVDSIGSGAASLTLSP